MNIKKLKSFIIIIALIFLAENTAFAGSCGYRDINKTALQVELLTSPMINRAGKEKAAQIKVETHLILSMLFNNNGRPFQDVNAELDKAYIKDSVKGRKRILGVIADPEVNDGEVSAFIQISGGSGRFKITTKNTSINDYYENPSGTQLVDITPEHGVIEEETDMFLPVEAPEALYVLKEKCRQETEAILAEEAVSVKVDPKTGERKYYKKGTPFIYVDAQAYILEGKEWEFHEGVELPEYLSKSMNCKEGAMVLITGPFYRRKENAYYSSDIREMSDEEVYDIFKLRRVHDAGGKPVSIPILGIAGRSTLLPVSYTVNTPGQGKRHVFGLEFKNAGTPAYKAHNINQAFPATVIEKYVGQPGVFLNWEHQFGHGVPVGLGGLETLVMDREAETVKKGGGISRLTIGIMPWGGGNEDFPLPYGISLRVPLSDYRRLMPAFIDYNHKPQKAGFQAVLEDIGMTKEEYLEKFPVNFAKAFRGVIDAGIIQAEHGSLSNMDILGNVTDLNDFMLIKEYDIRYSGMYVNDWVNNFLMVIKLAADNDPVKTEEALNLFAETFFYDSDMVIRLTALGPLRDNLGFLKNAIYKYLKRTVAEEIAENKPSGSGKIENEIDKSSLNSRDVARIAGKYIENIIQKTGDEKENIPVDIIVDLSLIPRIDMERNVRTWAYLVLSCFSMKNINFTFNLPQLEEEKGMPALLARDRLGAAPRSEFENMLRAEIRRIIPAIGMDGSVIEEAEKRINIFSRDEAIQVPIMSKAALEWMRESGQDLGDNQYPVALDGFSFEDDQRILRDFASALTIGLSKAALLIAKKRHDEKKAGENEYNELKERLFHKLSELYKVLNENITFTEDTLENMIYPDSAVRMNLAISLALPPVVKAYYQELTEYYERIQLMLQAA